MWVLSPAKVPLSHSYSTSQIHAITTSCVRSIFLLSLWRHVVPNRLLLNLILTHRKCDKQNARGRCNSRDWIWIFKKHELNVLLLIIWRIWTNLVIGKWASLSLLASKMCEFIFLKCLFIDGFNISSLVIHGSVIIINVIKSILIFSLSFIYIYILFFSNCVK